MYLEKQFGEWTRMEMDEHRKENEQITVIKVSSLYSLLEDEVFADEEAVTPH